MEILRLFCGVWLFGLVGCCCVLVCFSHFPSPLDSHVFSGNHYRT